MRYPLRQINCETAPAVVVYRRTMQQLDRQRVMRVEYALGVSMPAPVGPAALTIGVFDGVHIGHQQVLQRVAALAHEQKARAVAITFWPHPGAILALDAPPPQFLSTLEERLTALEDTRCLDAVLVLPFTPQLAALTPAAFLDLIDAWCQPRSLVEGPDFALGQGRAGDLAFLHAEGMRRGFTVETVEVLDEGRRVSSTRIRELVREGEMGEVTRLLGHPYILAGEVVTGDQRGRLLGYPTANLRLDPRKVLPAKGIYAVRVKLPGESCASHFGAASIGIRPTFEGEPKLLVEVYLLDTTMDLYGLTLSVEVVARLREERRYPSAEALIEQMALDVQETRTILASTSA